MDGTTIIKEPPKRPPGYYGRIGKLGGAVVREKHGGNAYFRKLGSLGGRATRTSQGKGYYARIGKLGAEARHRNWMSAKKAEAVR